MARLEVVVDGARSRRHPRRGRPRLFGPRAELTAALLLLALALALGLDVLRGLLRFDHFSASEPLKAMARLERLIEAGWVLADALQQSRAPPLSAMDEAFLRATARGAEEPLLEVLEGLGPEEEGLREDLTALRDVLAVLIASPQKALAERPESALRKLLLRLSKEERRLRHDQLARMQEHLALMGIAHKRFYLLFIYLLGLVLTVSALLVIARLRAQAAERAERRLEDAIACLSDGFALYDASGRLRLANRRFRELAPREEPAPSSGKPRLCRSPAGRILCLRAHGTSDGGRVVLLADVTELERHKEALALSERRFRALAETAPIGIWLLASDGRTVFANPALVRLLGFSPDNGGWESLAGRLGASQAARLRSLLREVEAEGAQEIELAWPTAAGTRHLLLAAAPPARPGGEFVLTVLDVSAQKRALLELSHLAHHDPLTGLANRRLLMERLEARCGRPGGRFFLGVLDLDGFREINQLLGHEEGDRLLRALSSRLDEMRGEGGLAARLGGDTFALLFPEEGEEEVRERASALLARLGESLEIGGRRLVPRARIGLAAFPDHGRSPDRLLRAADLALQQLKRERRQRVGLFDPAFAEALSRRRDLVRDLERALGEGELELVLQPQLALEDGRLVGAEVLLRWYHRRLERVIPPSLFVPLAEESGLASRLDRYVVERALSLWRGLAKMGAAPPRLAVNLSASELRDGSFCDWLERRLRELGPLPGQLEVEITEHALVERLEEARAVLGRLRRIEVAVALDDFGTGYACLAYLAELPCDRLKIDRSFTRGVEESRTHRSVVRAILGLGRQLGMEVVAEGVESEAQRAFLLREGCALGQGYLWARPMSEARFVVWCRERAGDGSGFINFRLNRP